MKKRWDKRSTWSHELGALSTCCNTQIPVDGRFKASGLDPYESTHVRQRGEGWPHQEPQVAHREQQHLIEKNDA